MRVPKYLSHSSLSQWSKDQEEFYLLHLAGTRAPRQPQQTYMSVGSAFDAYVKNALHESLFGKGADPAFEFDKIFTDQVEVQNRDWALEHGKYIFDCYVYSGAYADLLEMLQKSKEPPRFEFKVDGVLNGIVPFLGKPDCRFVHECGVHVILDWKVKGYCSKYGASPSKNYRMLRDGYDPKPKKIDATRLCPEGKNSLSHGKAHKWYVPYDHHGLEINHECFSRANREYADQLAAYGWLLGEKIGDENVVVCIDEIVAKYMGDEKPLLRIVNHRSRISEFWQMDLLKRATDCWEIINSDHIFREVSWQESKDRCELLDQKAISMFSDGTLEGDYFAAVARPSSYFR